MDTLNVQHIPVERTARYYTLGRVSEELQEIWFVLHGYGQLAQYFIRHFQPIVESGKRLIVAPEGLSRFYLDGRYERVGASWMTREDRHLEIADQATYLNSVYQRVMLELADLRPRVQVLGFSQGTATAWRWAMGQDVPFDNLILWGGAIPIEFDHPERFRDRGLFLCVGSEDEYVTPERFAEQKDRLDKAGIPHEVLRYTGGHTIPEDALKHLVHLLRVEGSARVLNHL